MATSDEAILDEVGKWLRTVPGRRTMSRSFASRVVVGSLVTWRVTHLLAEEDGPADVILNEAVLLWPALSGAACLLESAIRDPLRT